MLGLFFLDMIGASATLTNTTTSTTTTTTMRPASAMVIMPGNSTRDYMALCSGNQSSSPECRSFLYKQSNYGFGFTNYLSREDAAIESAFESLESDWTFIVSEFARVQPLVDKFTSSGGVPMNALIANLSSQVDLLRNETAPVLLWASGLLGGLFKADSADTVQLTREMDSVAQLALDRAMTATQVNMHDPNELVLNSTRDFGAFWKKEFSRVRALADANQSVLQATLQKMKDRFGSFKSRLASQTSKLETDSSLKKVYLSKLPAAIADGRTALGDRIKSEFYTSFNSPKATSVGPLLTKLDSFTNASIASVRNQFNTALDDLGDTVEDGLKNSSALLLNARNAGGSAFNESQARFLNGMDFFSGMLAAAANAAQVDQTHKNEFVLTDADLGENAMVLFARVKQNISDLLSVADKDLPIRVAALEQEVRTYAANSLWMTDQALLKLGEYVAGSPNVSLGVAQWNQLREDLINKVLLSYTANFTRFVSDLKTNITHEIMASALAGVDIESDSRLSEFLKNDYSFLNEKELNDMSLSTDEQRAKLFDAISTKIQSVLTLLDAPKKAQEIDAIPSMFRAQLNTAIGDGESLLRAEIGTSVKIVSELRSRVVEGPASEELDHIAAIQDSVRGLMDSLDAVSKGSKQYGPTVEAIQSELRNAVRTISDTSNAASSRFADSLQKAVTDAHHAVDQYVDRFVTQLPISTGFAQQLSDKTAVIDEILKFIADQNAKFTQTLNAKVSAVDQFVSLVAYSKGVIGSAGTVIDKVNAMEPPNFSDSNLKRDFINFDQEAKSMANSVEAKIADIKSTVDSKAAELSIQLHEQEDKSTARTAQISSLTASDRNSTIDAITAPQTQKIGKWIIGLDSEIKQLTDEIDTIGSGNRVQFDAVKKLLNGEKTDLKHQLEEAVPDFLAHYESERVKAFTDQFVLVNATIGEIAADAQSAYTTGVSSLIHKHSQPVAHRVLVQMLADLRQKETELAALQNATLDSEQVTSALIADHTQQAPLVINDTLNETSESVSRGLNATFSRAEIVLKRVENVPNRAATEQGSLDVENKDTIKQIGENLKMFEQVLKDANLTDMKSVADPVKLILSQINDFQQIFAEMAPRKMERQDTADATTGATGATSGATAGTSRATGATTETTKTTRATVGTSGATGTTNATTGAIHPSDSFETYRREIDSKFNQTDFFDENKLRKIESILSQLRILSQNEDKIENDFDTQILPKLRRKLTTYDPMQKTRWLRDLHALIRGE